MPRLARRWGWVVVPMLGVLAFEALQDTWLHDTLPVSVHLGLLAAVLLGGALVVAGTLFRRFDRMTAMLLEQKDELEARSAATAALQRVGIVVSGLRDLDRVLDTVAEQARLLLGGEIAIVCLADETGLLARGHGAAPARRSIRVRRAARIPTAAAAPVRSSARRSGTTGRRVGTAR